MTKEDAVQDQGVDVDIQIERPAKPLEDGHGAPTTVGHVLQLRKAPQPAQHRAQVDGDDGAAEVVVLRQPITQAVRQTQHPLPYRDIGEDVVHQVRGPLGHPPAATARTEAATLAREGDQSIQAGRASKPREAAGQPAAAEEVAKLLFDEPRQALAVAQGDCLRAKGPKCSRTIR